MGSWSTFSTNQGRSVRILAWRFDSLLSMEVKKNKKTQPDPLWSSALPTCCETAYLTGRRAQPAACLPLCLTARHSIAAQIPIIALRCCLSSLTPPVTHTSALITLHYCLAESHRQPSERAGETQIGSSGVLHHAACCCHGRNRFVLPKCCLSKAHSQN